MTAAERKKARKAKKAAKKRAMRQAGKKPRHIGGWIVFSLIALVLAAFLLYCFTPLGHNWYEFDIVVDKLDPHHPFPEAPGPREGPGALQPRLTLAM